VSFSQQRLCISLSSGKLGRAAVWWVSTTIAEVPAASILRVGESRSLSCMKWYRAVLLDDMTDTVLLAA